MTTLFDVLLDTARTCGVLISGNAQSVSYLLGNVYVTDSHRVEQTGYFDSGTMFIRSGTLADRTFTITSYDQNDKEFVLDYTGSSFVANANVYYSASNQHRDSLVQAVNLALTHMGMYTTTNEELELAQSTLSYTLPDGVSNIVRVESPVRYDAINTTLYAYEKLYHWEEDQGILRFKYPTTGAYGVPFRIYYNKYHDEVNADSDVIHDGFNRARIMWTAAYFFEYERMQFSGNADQKETLLMQTAAAKEMQMSQTFPVISLGRDPKLETYR